MQFSNGDLSPLRFFASGLMLEFAGNGVLYPFYYCKTHLQVNDSKCVGNPITSLFHQIKTTQYHNGIKGLYRGYVWSTLTSFPGIIAHIAIYNAAKRNICFENPLMNNALAPFLSGLLAEAIGAIVYVPSDVTTGRYILSKRTESLSTVLRKIYADHGLSGFWHGTFATLNTYVPAAGIWWASYEMSKHLSNSQNLFGCTCCGMIAGTTTAILTNPMDVIRTRITTQVGNYHEKNSLKLIHKIYLNEGIHAFGKGIGARFSLLLLEGLAFANFYEILMYLSTMPLPIVNNEHSLFNKHHEKISNWQNFIDYKYFSNQHR